MRVLLAIRSVSRSIGGPGRLRLCRASCAQLVRVVGSREARTHMIPRCGKRCGPRSKPLSVRPSFKFGVGRNEAAT